mgnify:CR=1 FL=1
MQTSEVQKSLKERTKQFALRIIRLYVALPKREEAQVLGKQLLRSGTSVGAQYHEAQRSRSDAELASKLESALQEIEETCYWLDLVADSGVVPATRLEDLRREAGELTAILITCVRNVKRRIARSR